MPVSANGLGISLGFTKFLNKKNKVDHGGSEGHRKKGCFRDINGPL